MWSVIDTIGLFESRKEKLIRYSGFKGSEKLEWNNF